MNLLNVSFFIHSVEQIQALPETFTTNYFIQMIYKIRSTERLPANMIMKHIKPGGHHKNGYDI